MAKTTTPAQPERWVEEFLYRGRPPSGPGSELSPAWHILIGEQTANPFDADAPPIRRVLGPLTPEQAEALGFPLATVVEAVNAAAISEAQARMAEAEQLRQQVSEAEGARLSALLSLKTETAARQTAEQSLQELDGAAGAKVAEMEAALTAERQARETAEASLAQIRATLGGAAPARATVDADVASADTDFAPTT